MNNLDLLNVSFVWIAFGQVSVCLLVGIIASLVWARNAARAHRLLSLSIAAAIVMPALSFVVSQLGWGQIVRTEQPMVHVETAEPTTDKTIMNDRDVSMPMEVALSARAIEEGAQPATVVPTPPVESVRTDKTSTNWVSGMLLAVWATFSALMFFRFLTSLIDSRRVLSRAKPLDDPAFSHANLSALSALGLRVAPRLLVSNDVRSPVIWCWGRRPVLLLPKLLGATAAWIGVLCHELAHWKRRDHLWALMSQALTILLPWHPLCWWARWRLDVLSEQACDDWALAGGTSPVDYAEFLLNLLPENRPQLALAAVRSKKSLVVRLKRILTNRKVNPVVGRKWTLSATAAAMLLAATIALAQVREEAQKDNPQEPNGRIELAANGTTKPKRISKPTESEANDDEFAVINGKVVDPDGNPVVGARVSLTPEIYNERSETQLSETTSSAKGRFQLRFTKSAAVHGSRNAWKYSNVFAAADGFAPTWISTNDVAGGNEVTLRLVRDDMPIRGRILNAEGQPVRGATLTVRNLWRTKSEDLSNFLKEVKTGQQMFPALGVGVSGPVVKTDAQGRFELTGIGRERVVKMNLEGKGIAKTRLDVVTRDMKPISRLWTLARPRGGTLTFYGANFNYAAQPSRPIVGRVYDIDTGKPLKGAVVQSHKVAGCSPWESKGFIKTLTDEKGRFRLTGMPKARGSEIFVVPTTEQPYFPLLKKVPDTKGFKTAEVEFGLKRGVWIAGRVTDQTNGKPVFSRVHYYPFLSNKHAKKFANFLPGESSSVRMRNRFRTNADGTFRVVGIPGRGLVAAVCTGETYCKGNGADRIKGLNERGDFNTYFMMGPCSSTWYHSIVEVNPKAHDKTVRADLLLDPGRSISVQIADADGQPLTGVTAVGLGTQGIPATVTGDTAKVVSLDRRFGRFLQLRHEEKNLGRIVRVDSKTPDLLKIRLAPCASISGRIVDVEGRPFPGVEIDLKLVKAGDFSGRFPEAHTDMDGRYRFDNVLPGWDYYLYAAAKGDISFSVSKLVSIQPGKNIDLGAKVAKSDQ